MKRFLFENLKTAPLELDAVYEGGSKGDFSDEPLSILLPKMQNQGGIRVAYKNNGKMKDIAYVVLYTNMSVKEYPDTIDYQNGVFCYYGDNKTAGQRPLDSYKRGNLILKSVFEKMQEKKFKEIPPILLFKKEGKGRNVRFLGLAVPGLIESEYSFYKEWFLCNEERFQNYKAYFTILDTGEDEISRKWLEALINDESGSLLLAPDCWKRYRENGLSGVQPLKLKSLINYSKIYTYYKNYINKCYLIF